MPSGHLLRKSLRAIWYSMSARIHSIHICSRSLHCYASQLRCRIQQKSMSGGTVTLLQHAVKATVSRMLSSHPSRFPELQQSSICHPQLQISSTPYPIRAIYIASPISRFLSHRPTLRYPHCSKPSGVQQATSRCASSASSATRKSWISPLLHPFDTYSTCAILHFDQPSRVRSSGPRPCCSISVGGF